MVHIRPLTIRSAKCFFLNMICLATNPCLVKKNPEMSPFEFGYFSLSLYRALLLKEISLV